MPTLAPLHETASHTTQTLLTAADIAERLAVPKSSIYEAARQYRIGGVIRVGRTLRFDPLRFQAWLEAGGQALPGGWQQEDAK